MLEPLRDVRYTRGMKRYPYLQELTRERHIRMVQEIFSTVTDRYDVLTHLLSLWRDVWWRRFAAGKLQGRKPRLLLDVATGTADLAIEMALQNPGCSVVAMDLMAEMMALGRGKVRRRELSNRVPFVRGDALNMPFPTGTFDAAAIAFGIRNIPDKDKALREMCRVTAPGGRVLVLEMTRPGHGFFQRLYTFYLERIMPLAARIFSPNPAAYRYLADSILHFPSPSEFSGMMRKAGLGPVEAYPLTLGITHLFVGTKKAHGARRKDIKPEAWGGGYGAGSKPRRGVL